MFLVEDLVLGGYYFELGGRSKLERCWNIPWFNLSKKFHLNWKILEFWPFFLYLDTGRLVGEFRNEYMHFPGVRA